MPALAYNARPAADPAPGPAADRRRQWAVKATTAADDDSSLFDGVAPPAPPRPARAAAARVAPTREPAVPPAAPRPVPVLAPGPAARPGWATWQWSLAGAGLFVAVVAGYLILSALFSFVQTTANDLAYGRPRTTHLDAFFGHTGEQASQPTHVLALNLDRRIVLIELPGGDTQGASTITGPYLFGAGEDLTPIQLAAQDVNGDGQPDLLIDVKNEQLVYINDRDKSTFHLMTAKERGRLQPSLSQGGGAADGGQK